MYLVRINEQLERFIGAWNNHRLRTEHNHTPLQLWARGILAATPQVSDNISEGLLLMISELIWMRLVPTPLTVGQWKFLNVRYT